MIRITGFSGTEKHPQTDLEIKGLILRDIFAGMAMQGMSAHPGSQLWTHEEVARSAYGQADAMLAAREEQP